MMMNTDVLLMVDQAGAILVSGGNGFSVIIIAAFTHLALAAQDAGCG